MPHLSALIDLKDNFPESNWPWVIPDLQYDALIWKVLQNPEFRGAAIQKFGNLVLKAVSFGS